MHKYIITLYNNNDDECSFFDNVYYILVVKTQIYYL